ncbi:MAG: hypothetical protein JK586_14270 [Nocardiopsis sp. BM-2018]|uniref:DUF2567 domain-containing protein n=1 Tax=Nocardiopsis metallicus TaxID=179819 RepID=A0A840W003_9ACTN|nr:hypothetical protein [Nocardiopsis metallicus]MBB5489294.1 hypothetical protein [Nocardiopsis metallicus]QRN79435.1 MAG: hypothetical protein JK586_14270 [Nocardiopsis sp. BM-2018]
MAEQSGTGASGLVRGLAVGAAFFGGVALLGALLGPLWWWLAPRPEVVVLPDGGVFTGASETVFAGEGYFVLITALAGLVTGYATYMLQFSLARRSFQDLRLVGLVAGALGSVVAALLVWQIGVALDGPARESVQAAGAGDTVIAALQLQATAFLVAWPFVYILQYGLLDAFSLLRGDQPGVPEPVHAEKPVPEKADLHTSAPDTLDSATPALHPPASSNTTATPAPEGQEPPVVAEGENSGPEGPRS